MKFQPRYIISIGDTGALLTLRIIDQYVKYVEGQPHKLETSYHVKNLGQNPEEAYAKAEAYAKEQGLPLVTTKKILEQNLRHITKRTKEEIEAERKKSLESQLKQSAAKADEADYKLMKKLVSDSANGLQKFVFPFGKYHGESMKEIVNVDRGYAEYIADYTNDELVKHKLLFLLGESKSPEVINEYFGEVGIRQSITAIVTKKIQLLEGIFGPTTLIKMRTLEGHELVIFTNSDIPNVGSKIKFNAMIKKHSLYNGLKQTQINRITKLEKME